MLTYYSIFIKFGYSSADQLILPVTISFIIAALIATIVRSINLFFWGLSFYLYVESQSLGTDSIESITWACLSVLLTISLILRYSLFISIIGSWVAPTSNNALLFICHGITQPLLRPFQRLTAFGGIDFSPIIVFFILIQIDRMIHNLRFYLELPGLF